jgi:mono/diheme cytochrome c family protein
MSRLWVLGVVAALAGLAAPALAQDRGKILYITRCSPCHGAEGRGDGPGAVAIEPKPRNFRDPEFWRTRTEAQIRDTILKGKPGTLMSPFEGALSDDEITAVIRHLETFKPASD